MKDDYATKSHYLAYTSFSLSQVGRMYFFELESEIARVAGGKGEGELLCLTFLFWGEGGGGEGEGFFLGGGGGWCGWVGGCAYSGAVMWWHVILSFDCVTYYFVSLLITKLLRSGYHLTMSTLPTQAAKWPQGDSTSTQAIMIIHWISWKISPLKSAEATLSLKKLSVQVNMTRYKTGTQIVTERKPLLLPMSPVDLKLLREMLTVFEQ